MKVLLVNGSSHKTGNTYQMLQIIAECLSRNGIESEIFQLGTDKVHGCIGCNGCKTTSRCLFADDCCNELIDAMINADGVVIGSPVYFAGPNGALCAVLDRVFFAGAENGRLFAHKPAAAVVSCYRAGSTAALDRLNKYFTFSEMPIVSSNYWNMIIDQHSNRVQRDKEGQEILCTLAANMSRMLHQIESLSEKE
ncbi:MAG: flavodoxin family protein [Ruminococcaceae bacterium]|nr:flavodoxin family protein [Oscillospiraceae bacterium]